VPVDARDNVVTAPPARAVRRSHRRQKHAVWLITQPRHDSLHTTVIDPRRCTEGLQLGGDLRPITLDPCRAIEPHLANGRVNDTYRVRMEGKRNPPLRAMQRTIPSVFPQPSVHGAPGPSQRPCGARLNGKGASRLCRGQCWEMPRILPANARNAESVWEDERLLLGRLVVCGKLRILLKPSRLRQGLGSGHWLGCSSLIRRPACRRGSDTWWAFTKHNPHYRSSTHAVVGTGSDQDDPDVAPSACVRWSEREWG